MFINLRKIIFWLAMLLAVSASADMITDMAGRKVNVPAPDKVKRIFTASTAVSYLVYAVAPEKLCGLNRPWRHGDEKYLVPTIRNKPVLGGWLGQGGRISNSEEILATGPQLVFASMVKKSSLGNKIEKNLKMLRIPLLFVKSSELKNLPEAFKFVGKVTGKSSRAEKLCAATERLLKRIAEIKPPKSGRLRIYYSFSPDGFAHLAGT